MSTTALQIVTDAYADLQVFQAGDAPSPEAAQLGLRHLNLMVGGWAQDTGTIPAVSRLVFPLLAGKGSSTNPYTVGLGGDLNTPRFVNQASVVDAGLLLNASVPPVEIPRGIMTNEAFAANRVKDLTSGLFTSAYYRPDYVAGFGSLFLWPVPTDLTNRLVLYVRQAIASFADLLTSYTFPLGYDDAFRANLILRLARSAGRPIDQDMRDDARRTLALIQRGNVQLSDLPNDFAGIGTPGGARYDILVGDG